MVPTNIAANQAFCLINNCLQVSVQHPAWCENTDTPLVAANPTKELADTLVRWDRDDGIRRKQHASHGSEETGGGGGGRGRDPDDDRVRRGDLPESGSTTDESVGRTEGNYYSSFAEKSNKGDSHHSFSHISITVTNAFQGIGN